MNQKYQKLLAWRGLREKRPSELGFLEMGQKNPRSAQQADKRMPPRLYVAMPEIRRFDDAREHLPNVRVVERRADA